jgi:hypothetical protein
MAIGYSGMSAGLAQPPDYERQDFGSRSPRDSHHRFRAERQSPLSRGDRARPILLSCGHRSQQRRPVSGPATGATRRRGDRHEQDQIATQHRSLRSAASVHQGAYVLGSGRPLGVVVGDGEVDDVVGHRFQVARIGVADVIIRARTAVAGGAARQVRRRQRSSGSRHAAARGDARDAFRDACAVRGPGPEVDHRPLVSAEARAGHGHGRERLHRRADVDREAPGDDDPLAPRRIASAARAESEQQCRR